MGLVFCVILLVKSVTFPTTLLEKLDIPVAMLAANSPPGRLGSALPVLPDPGVDTGLEGLLLVLELRAYPGS
jgi:hypothetical protein